MTLRIASVVLFLLSVTACNSGPRCTGTTTFGSSTCLVGEPCSEHDDCESRLCGDDHLCAASCDRAADCAAGEACVSNDDGSIACGTTCGSNFDFVGESPGLVCEGGSVVSCAAATDPDSICDSCGCSTSGESCIHPLADLACGTVPGDCYCGVPAAVGEPCTFHEDCASGNCSGTSESTERRCQIAAGQTCTDGSEDCVHCNQPVNASGDLVCRQSCDGSLGCNGGVCLGNLTTHEFGCYTDCTDDSTLCGPGEHCDFVLNDAFNRRYCAPN